MRSCVPPNPDSRTLRPIQRSFYLPGTMPGIREVVRRHVPTGLPSLPMETLRHAGQTRTWSKPGTSQAGRRWITRGRIDRAVSAHAQAFATRLTRHGLALSSPAPSLARWARRQMSLATMGSKLPGSSFRNVTPSESVKAPSLATRHPSRRPLGPVGSGRAQTLPRWLLPATDRPIAKDRTGPDLDERPLYIQYREEKRDIIE